MNSYLMQLQIRDVSKTYSNRVQALRALISKTSTDGRNISAKYSRNSSRAR